MKPAEVLFDAAVYGSIWSSGSRDRPGAVIERLTPDRREILKNLKAEDIQIWWYLGDDTATTNKKRFSKWLQSWDRKLNLVP